MKHAAVLCCLFALLCAIAPPAAADVAFEPFPLEEVGVTAMFPEGWTVVTPQTTAENMRWFDEPSAEIAANNLLSAGVLAIAFSPEGDETLRIMMSEDDESALYYDISRYTSQMRSDIRSDFLDQDAWSLTGYRFTQGEWTNREGEGYLLWLTYSLRYGEETVARGQWAFTVRGGKRFMLEYRSAEKMTDEAQSMFKSFVRSTVFPAAEESEMPLLPVGLTTSASLPEETNKASNVIRGTTEKQATVSASLIDAEGNEIEAGSTTADNSGSFKLTLTLPGEGEWQLRLVASKEGYAQSALTGWITCDYDWIPVNFTSYLSGDVYDTTLKISGKTLASVKIQCIEGETNKTAYSDSSGNFSFTLDKGITGERTVVLAMSKKGCSERRFVITFNRCWEEGEYAKYLDGQVQSLSYANLAEKGDRYVGRIIQYDGVVQEVSSSGERWYVQIARDGDLSMQFIAVRDGEPVTLREGDAVTVYCEVTGESYSFPYLTEDGEEALAELPSVLLLLYEMAETEQ